MKKVQTFLFVVHFCLVMIVIGGTIFSVMVEYPNWFANIPSSMTTTRDFYKVLHPGYFFQIFAPLALFSGIGFAIAGWRLVSTRNLVLISVVIMISAELLTFFYIYPRLNIMFGPDTASNSLEVLRQAANDFTNADRIRTLLGFTAAGFSVAALMKFFRFQGEAMS